MTTEQLFSKQSNGPDTTLVVNVNRIDMSIADAMKRGMLESISAAQGQVTIDMEHVGFIDSSGLGALVSVRKSLAPNREMHLTNTSKFVSRVLSLTKLDKVFSQ